MAVHLTEDSIKMGYLLPIANLGRKPTESLNYYALKIEDNNGDNESWILLSLYDFTSRPVFSMDGFSPKLGRRHSFKIGEKEFNVIKVRFCERTIMKNGFEFNAGDEASLLFNKSIIKRAAIRASKNKEDIPEQSFWNDLKD